MSGSTPLWVTKEYNMENFGRFIVCSIFLLVVFYFLCSPAYIIYVAFIPVILLSYILSNNYFSGLIWRYPFRKDDEKDINPLVIDFSIFVSYWAFAALTILPIIVLAICDLFQILYDWKQNQYDVQNKFRNYFDVDKQEAKNEKRKRFMKPGKIVINGKKQERKIDIKDVIGPAFVEVVETGPGAKSSVGDFYYIGTNAAINITQGFGYGKLDWTPNKLFVKSVDAEIKFTQLKEDD